jgi:hypothetical protein|tara:strand:- start:24372 stop:24980 length:609 start_codon:yes stop_codon:yes gene_type:complete
MARGGSYNMKKIATKIAKSKVFTRASLKNAEKKYGIEKKKLLQRFDAHAVTQEIEGGVSASNLSNTLGGRGNLFTYIGFQRGTNPVAEVQRVLLTSGEVKRSGQKSKAASGGKRIQLSFRASIPNVNLLKSASPMPFQGGRSWLFDVETGISGFNYYMYKRFNRGRSGMGLQSKTPVKTGSYKPPSNGYIRKLLAQFIASFK